jgi:hypothetical protein
LRINVGQALSPVNPVISAILSHVLRERFAGLCTTGANLCRALFAAALPAFSPTNSILGLDIKIVFI